ncbi:hypothetical protein FE374_11545 [Georgenia yuyongxinii]|uniref:Uncharacterized protein n=1 Tax=Georgenia yuyongxinii TaxID=2589797 RepID=A0A5B8C7K2_9MICO|nr:hypothetical protein [Georgenia yuyongxinii]QDC25152.1 hypothetical protein FE374_11545 [Georgenia yuyongxinii]
MTQTRDADGKPPLPDRTRRLAVASRTAVPVVRSAAGHLWPVAGLLVLAAGPLLGELRAGAAGRRTTWNPASGLRRPP